MAQHARQRYPARPRRPAPSTPAVHGPRRPPFVSAAVLLAVVAVVLAGWLHTSGRWPFEPDAGPPPSLRPAPPVLGAPVVDVGPATALAVLETLQVKGRSPGNNYQRSAFGEAWLDADANGCDTRNDILRRDLTATALADGQLCTVAAGTLQEPYTGKEVAFKRGRDSSGDVQIDHVVALGNAWQSGAAALTAQQRQSLANDPLNLLAVDGQANQDKSASDAATWLPPNKGFRCQYVARQISVKAAYRLWVTPAEKAAMQRVLGLCPKQQSLPSGYPP
ncbi:hypothetical protein JOF48_002969 [Arthrobacter stackebrandtii]|uniref:GmrSD restriction endonucleases C-terminal domain-containing protein n=1 Tax=Arthrobacter stackebrandtii TaxID=272161 RepID=A0ABS4Z0E3_9MICC|nr:HNH endonuclease family protein [Arthrobacter stackebrandtii]MBP2414170.1 hypothetical protein [Arthrobacter stackebrandtii]PYG98961.1 HNH endonuclease [Arthrobacter stackebrandtii]